jgi:hypothetical protein
VPKSIRNESGFTGCGKTRNSVILSEAKNLSLFLFLNLNRRGILRFAQNDRTRLFFRSGFGRWPARNRVAELTLQPVFA